MAFNGAEPIHLETLERFTKYFAPYGFKPEAFLTCYGLAEATLMVSGGPKEKIPKSQRLSKKELAKTKRIFKDAARNYFKLKRKNDIP